MPPEADLSHTDGAPPASALPDSRLLRLWTRRDRRLQLLALAIGLGIVAVIAVLRGPISAAELVGYPGVFFLSMMGSAAMLLPVPGIASVCAAGVLLNPLAVGVIAAFGETVGEISGYAVGYGGQSMVVKRRFYRRVRALMRRRGTLILFLVSTIPNPIFDVVGIAAGATRFPLRRFLVTVLAGKLVKSIAVAYACSEGFKHLLPGVD